MVKLALHNVKTFLPLTGLDFTGKPSACRLESLLLNGSDLSVYVDSVYVIQLIKANINA